MAPGLKSIEEATTIRHKILHAFEGAERLSGPVRHYRDKAQAYRAPLQSRMRGQIPAPDQPCMFKENSDDPSQGKRRNEAAQYGLAERRNRPHGVGIRA